MYERNKTAAMHEAANGVNYRRCNEFLRWFSPISNSESANFVTDILYDFFFNWQTEKKTVLDQ
jgi:hypothetical protein